MEHPEREGWANRAAVSRLAHFLKRNWWQTGLGVIACFLLLEYISLPFSKIEDLKTAIPTETAFMLEQADRARQEGKKFHKVQSIVALDRIPKDAISAVVVAEDGMFWSHNGFDWFEFRESFIRNLREFRFARGGSTITQQLVKNLFLSSSKDPIRKLKEWILTWKIERTLSKSRIIELYLNTIEWGDGIYGIGAASQRYFQKPVSELTREEAARLAAVIPSPRRYRADSESRYVRSRTTTILGRMEARGL
jgi:monofunctional biosynthetic peptidoglycan transglycosylase